MPSHITINGLGLTFKTTVGISTATIPDVCKTPSPGGPIPIPYPNIATQSTLRKGTTTVKAKGQMIAVKGSQYGMSMGDEPGTAGGVKSSTFKQATDWITYSFDVKMDGKNACRHTDKKFHNNKNTVNLAGDIDPALKGGKNPLKIKCDGARYAGKKLDKCEIEEICCKCKTLNKMAKDGKLKRRAASYEDARYEGDLTCASINRYARTGRGVGGEGKPEDMGFHVTSGECHETLKKRAKRKKYKGFSPDHVQEIQLGGHPSATSNLKWMSSGANSWIGNALKQFKTSGKDKHTGVQPDCC